MQTRHMIVQTSSEATYDTMAYFYPSHSSLSHQYLWTFWRIDAHYLIDSPTSKKPIQYQFLPAQSNVSQLWIVFVIRIMIKKHIAYTISEIMLAESKVRVNLTLSIQWSVSALCTDNFKKCGEIFGCSFTQVVYNNRRSTSQSNLYDRSSVFNKYLLFGTNLRTGRDVQLQIYFYLREIC